MIKGMRWLSEAVISKIKTQPVIGAFVTPEKNAVIPSAMKNEP